MTVIAICKHNTKKYCKNWDGKGDPQLLEDIDHLFLGQCPASKKDCSFLVTPKPSPELRVS